MSSRRRVGEPANRTSQIVAGKRAISADTALRLARYFGTSPDLRMNLQKTYELDLARQQLGKAITHIPQRPPRGYSSFRPSDPPRGRRNMLDARS